MAADKFAISRWTAEERLDELLAVVQAAFAGLAPPSSVMNETVADLTRRLRDGLVLVARADDSFIGSVFAARQGDALYLTRLAVAPSWRRRGVGRALMVAAESEARSAGLPRLILRVRTSPSGNRAYFEGQGFAVTGQGQDPGRAPYAVMERTLR